MKNIKNSNLVLKFCLLLMVIVNTKVFAQISHPFPTSNAMWSEFYQPPYFANPVPQIYAVFEEDTIINDYSYLKLFLLSDTMDVLNRRKYVGALRSNEESKVFFVPKILDEELLLYDFNVEIGDTIFSDPVSGHSCFTNPLVVVYIDSIEMVDHFRRRIYFEPYPDYPNYCTPWIEGIGSMRGLLFPSGYIPTNGIWGELVCFFEEDNLVYHNPLFDNCYPLPLSVPDQIVAPESILNIFPNPAINELVIESANREIERISVYDTYGEVKFLRSDIHSYKFKIDTISYEDGVYFLSVSFVDNTQHQMLFVVMN